MSQPLWTPKNVRTMRAVEDLPRDERAVEARRAAKLDPSGQDEAQSMEALGAFAGGIAHIFTNLLTAIGFETELAMVGLAPDDPARKHLREIEKAGERGAA